MSERRDGRVRRAWTRYRSRTMPEGASPVQVQETRRAFYGGAATLFLMLTGRGPDAILDHDTDPDTVTGDDLAALSAILDEIETFYRDVGTPREAREP